jgi:hypothetical protein
MNKKIDLIKKTLIAIMLFNLFFIYSTGVIAGPGSNAGVGVINVPPNYSDIKILQRENMIRVYLTLSDYNSWGDIYKVQLNLEQDGVVLHTFSFKQWESPDSFNFVNEFTEESDSSILQVEACDVSHSSETATVADRCHLNIRFVFRSTYFSELHIISSDRAGDTTETFIEYKGSDMNRGDNTMLIPWIDGTIKVELPRYLLDITIFLTALIATVMIGKRTPFAHQLQQVFYESK